VQLRWAREAGADAVLLIAALHGPGELAWYARLARGLGLVPLIETHDAGDVAKLLGEPWEMIGVNVAESGSHDALDLLMLRDNGVDAFLIGESLLLAPDPGAKLRELTGR
jgi:indole-3-glycerol phosphate synthase